MAWGALEVLCLRMAGATLVLSAAAEYCLKVRDKAHVCVHVQV